MAVRSEAVSRALWRRQPTLFAKHTASLFAIRYTVRWLSEKLSLKILRWRATLKTVHHHSRCIATQLRPDRSFTLLSKQCLQIVEKRCVPFDFIWPLVSAFRPKHTRLQWSFCTALPKPMAGHCAENALLVFKFVSIWMFQVKLFSGDAHSVRV